MEQCRKFLDAIPESFVIVKANDGLTLSFTNQSSYEAVDHCKQVHMQIFPNVGIATLYPIQAQTGFFCAQAKLRHRFKKFIYGHFSSRTHLYQGRTPGLVTADVARRAGREESFMFLHHYGPAYLPEATARHGQKQSAMRRHQ